MKRALAPSLLLIASCLGPALAQDAPPGDAAAGEKSFRICKSCHQIGEGAKNAVGPDLNGVVGRKSATFADYSYSDAMKASGLTWDEATLRVYLKGPRALVPGTKMTFAGFSRDTDVRNVIAYLKTFGPDGKPK